MEQNSVDVLTLPYDQGERLDKDLQVKQWRPVPQIFQIVADAFGHFLKQLGFATHAVYLRQAGDPRAHFMTNHITADEFAVHLVVGHGMRTRSDHAHLSLDYIE